MSVCLLSKMLHILVLCPVLLIGGVQTLTIDSQLGTSVEDCFERVSIGEQLPPSAIYRNVSELTTRECEQICKQDKQCQAYDYGVGAKGNATCNLSTQSEKEVKEKSFLSRHPDYDVYVRRFQCEQSPPTPIQTLLDDPDTGSNSNERPQHRPVFRPDVDERPLADDYLISSNIDPYNSGSKPISPYRPDGISQRPVFDVGPSYGDHKPQDITYPERPRPDPYRPNDPFRPNDSYGPSGPEYGNRPNDPYRPRPDPYRPERPIDPYRPSAPYRPNDPYKPQSDPYAKPKPETNDVLQFDAYRPEKPSHNYIIRPNRKPRPEEEFNKPLYDPYGPTGPVGPPYRPTRPEKPTYSYNSQYASNYGQNNDVEVAIYDPPRPYIPIKDRPGHYDQGFLGYGTYSSQNSYSQSQNSYTGSIAEIGQQNQLYGKPQSGQSYGQNNNKRPINDHQNGYQRPNDRYKPVNQYGGSQNYGGNQNSYGSNQSYGSSHNSNFNSFESQYGETGYKPSYNKPSYNGDKGDYGNQGYGNQGNQGYGTNSWNNQYGSQNNYGSNGVNNGNHGSYGGYNSYGSGNEYGNRPIYDYEIHKPGYGNEKPAYGNQKPEYDRPKPGYGNDKPEYDSRPGYGGQKPDTKPSYGNDRPDAGYGSSKPDSDYNKPGYGNSRPDYSQPSYSNDRPESGYGSSKPDSDYSKPGYGNSRPDYSKPSYGNDRPDTGYGSFKPNSDYSKPGYGNSRPDYSKPSYGNDRPDTGYGSSKPDSDYNKPGYGNSRPTDTDYRPGYGNRPDYTKPSYGNDKPDPGYGNYKPENDNSKPGYGNSRPDYSKPSYGNDRPDPGYGSSKPDSSYSSGYGNDKLDLKPGYDQKPENQPGYGGGNDKPDDTGYGSNSTQSYRPDIRPVYEYELDKPTNVPSYITRPGGEVVTSRPVVIAEYDRPGYKHQSYEACFRRVLAGRRALRSFVRRVVPCEQLEDCRRECAVEKTFHCESFNYRTYTSLVSCEQLENCKRECAVEKTFLGGPTAPQRSSILDTSFRGKGLCELMTKPIESFDQRRDFVDDKNYDFYEIDRNSLEPNCPETLRGPGSLHSGFLSSKPGWSDRLDQRLDRFDQRPDRFDQRPNRLDQRPNRVDQSGWRDRPDWMGFNRFSFDDRRNYGNNRFEEHYVPYQIGQIKPENNNWGQYGGSYGGPNGYYKDRNDYHKSIDHWGLNSYRPEYKKSGFDYHSLGKNLDISLTRNDFKDIHIDHKGSYGQGVWKRGRWDPYPSIGYKHIWEEPIPSLEFKHVWDEPNPESRDEDSDRHSHDGNSHVSHIHHDDGGNECYSHRKPGMSLSSGAIRKSLIANNVVQCESACFDETEFKCVSYSYRYSTSRGSENCFLSETPYRGLEMSSDSSSDVYAMPRGKCASTKPYVESECFWHVRSDTAVTGSDVRATLSVAGLGACEAECIRAQHFYCRGFSFKFGSPTIGDEDTNNCVLTSSPATSLHKTAAVGSELYARGNFGRGCEPAVYDELNSECYLQYDKAAKLTSAAIRGQARVKDEQTCGTACTEAPFRCLSFSYNNNAAPSTDNCLLSDIRLFDLQHGVDYVHAADEWLFAFDLFNSRCWRKVHTEEPSPELPHPIHTSAEDSHFHHSGPSGHTGPSGPTGPGYIPDSAPGIPYIPDSGPPTGPSGPTGLYKAIEGPYEPSSPEKPYPIQPYRPRPDPEIYRPGFKPPHSNNNDFKPSEVIIPYKPDYPDPEPNYRPERPSYRPDPPRYRPDPPSYKPDPPSYRPDPPSYRPDTPIYRPERPSYGPDPPSYRPKPPSYGPDRPFRPIEYPKDPGYKPVRPAKPGFSPGYLPGPQKPYPIDREDGSIETSWRHYTVSGFPCRAGTTCAQNKIVGHWACEPEGGEIGSWDYCCAPTHRCGYSEGFHKPWCYVGQKHDQWRPCSEKYYPYHHHNTPHPSQGNREPSRPRPWRDTPQPPQPPHSPWPVKAVTPPPASYTPHWDKPPGPYLSVDDRRYWDELYENGPKAYYDKQGNPLPGYSRVPTESRPYIRFKHNNRPDASGQWVPISDPPMVPGLGAPRYWPVAYLHRGPPPNMTYYRYNETRQTGSHDHNPTGHDRDKTQSRANDDDDGQTIDDYKPGRSYDGYNGHANDDYRPNDNRRSDDRNRNDEHNRRSDNHNRNDDHNRRSDDRRSDDKYNDNKSNGYNARNNNGVSRDSSGSRNNDAPNENRSRDNDNSREGDFARRNIESDRNDSSENVSKSKDEGTLRDDKKIDDRKPDNNKTNADKAKTTTTEAPIEKLNNSDVETIKPEDFKTMDSLKGIDDKLDDFSKSIEVLNIEDAKGDKISETKTLEAEERQIEAIGRLLASRRGGNIVLEKRSQKELDAKHIAVDKDMLEFNFGNRFNTERRGTIKRISKDEIERDKSLELSETTYVRPPRVLSTTENIRKAIVNGKVFYDATLRDPKEFNRAVGLGNNSTRRPKNLRRSDNTTPSIINNNNYGRKKIVRTRNVNPVRRVKRVYKKRYNPEEVRRRLLERDRNKNSTESKSA